MALKAKDDTWIVKGLASQTAEPNSVLARNNYSMKYLVQSHVINSEAEPSPR